MTALEKITKARALLVLEQPFFGALALRMALKEDSTKETMAIDGRSIYYNASWVDSLPSDQLRGVLCHEVLHVACDHTLRRSGRDHEEWNVACDYAINPLVRASGLRLPDGGLESAEYADMGAEQIYAARQAKRHEQCGGGQGSGGGSGAGQQSQSGQQGTPGAGKDPGGCGAVLDMPAPDGGQMSPAQAAQAAAETRVAVKQAAMAAKAAGNLPGGLAALVDKICDPVIPWQDVLRRFMDKTAKSDYLWSPPNRRHVWRGLYLPSCSSEEMRPIVVAVDVSGSCWGDLGRFASELSAICEDCPISTVHTVYCDTQPIEGPTYTKHDLPIEFKPVGGGGTDFRPVFDWIDAQGIDPAALVFFTDGYGDAPKYAPSYPVIWCLTHNGRHPAKWGEAVTID